MVSIILETDLHVSRLGGMDAQRHRNLCAVRGVLVDTELHVLPELHVTLMLMIFILRDQAVISKNLLARFLLMTRNIFVLLQCRTRNVEAQVLGVDDALELVEPFRHQCLTAGPDEGTAHIQLDIVSLP